MSLWCHNCVQDAALPLRSVVIHHLWCVVRGHRSTRFMAFFGGLSLFGQWKELLNNRLKDAFFFYFFLLIRRRTLIMSTPREVALRLPSPVIGNKVLRNWTKRAALFLVFTLSNSSRPNFNVWIETNELGMIWRSPSLCFYGWDCKEMASNHHIICLFFCCLVLREKWAK